jgi:hypothetical protein
MLMVTDSAFTLFAAAAGFGLALAAPGVAAVFDGVPLCAGGALCPAAIKLPTNTNQAKPLRPILFSLCLYSVAPHSSQTLGWVGRHAILGLLLTNTSAADVAELAIIALKASLSGGAGRASPAAAVHVGFRAVLSMVRALTSYASERCSIAGVARAIGINDTALPQGAGPANAAAAVNVSFGAIFSIVKTLTTDAQ